MRRILFTLIGIFAGIGAAFAEAPLLNAHQAEFTGLDGKPMPLSQYRGKLLLVVNTASQCGFTPQYAGLQKLYEAYRDKGLVVLGVPSNDFGSQEPGTEADIARFTQENFKITFPMTAKTHVIGKGAHPFYQWAAREAGLLGAPKWNFHKYLISPEGLLLEWYSSTTAPDSEKLIQAIENNLPAKS